MFDFIEKLREKPDRIKRKVAFLTASCFSVVILLLWISVIYPDFRDKQQKINNIESSPTSVFGKTIDSGISEFGDRFSKIKDLISSITKKDINPAHFTASSSEANVIAPYIPTSIIEEESSTSTENGQPE